MYPHKLGLTLLTLVLTVTAPAIAADYDVKIADKSAPPAEVSAAIKALLSDRAFQFVDGKGELLAEVWMRKELPVKATDAQIKNGLTYQEVPETTLIGVIRWARETKDYRKQRVKSGVYTLRIANQPMDGDHMGTAPYSEFCLSTPANIDKSPERVEVKHLHEMSAKTTGSHPGIFLLFPGKGATDQPKVANKGDGHWVLLLRQAALAGDKKTILDIGLVLVGASTSA